MGEYLTFTPIRQQITVASLRGPDAVIGIGGIRLVARNENRPSGEDCLQFLFGDSGDIMLKIIMDYSREVDEIDLGIIAIYSNSFGNLNHVGVGINKQEVISKWGDGGHVFVHHPACVPDVYGPQLQYFRIPDDLDLAKKT